MAFPLSEYYARHFMIEHGDQLAPLLAEQDIARIRQRLNCSQAVFEMMLNISPKTVQAWEQGSREPGDAALKLLTIARKHPEVLLDV